MRDAAAKEIRKAGDRETAAIVAKLSGRPPRPGPPTRSRASSPNWSKRCSRPATPCARPRRPRSRAAGGRGLRDATLAQRKAIDAVMDAAADYKPGGKPLSGAMADRLRTTLNAVAGDEALREALSEGRLTGEAQAGGAWPFALEPSAEPAPKPKAKAKPAAKKKPAAAKKKTKDEQAAEREAKAREAAEQAARERAEKEARKALEKELRGRPQLAARARARTAGAEEDANDAAGRIGDAQDALEAAQQALEDAKSEAEAAQSVLTEARNALGQARDRVAALEEQLD